MSAQDKYARYQRQIQLKEFGKGAQDKLLNAKVLVIGAGGLGCPALQYLAAAGIGRIGIVDFDRVELSNLHRQILYTIDDIGLFKAEIAAKKLRLLNPEISIDAYQYAINTNNALELISNYDLVIDGSDNFPTRYLVNDACVILNKPMVYGAVVRFEGQVGVFNLETKDTKQKANYRDLFPLPPDSGSIPSCNEAGVLGVIPGIIGTMQATEAIKIITRIGNPLSNKIVSYNALNNSFYDFEIRPAMLTKVEFPKNKPEFLAFDYALHCDPSAGRHQISVLDFNALRSREPLNIIDVREYGEIPGVHEFEHVKIPFSIFKEEMKRLTPERTFIVFCTSGKRSAQAVQILKNTFATCTAYSLEGGIENWKKNSDL
ncbi:MAG: HesA/MoeB/ThiF family protein [bacterium]|nr:HesA/MoeB/ThiF family protein [bacterium]